MILQARSANVHGKIAFAASCVYPESRFTEMFTSFY